jgi:hypothetical protein
MTDLRHYINLVNQSDTPVAEAVKKQVGDKVMQNIVGQTAAQRLAASLPSTVRLNGVTWEKVGNNYINRKTDKVISTDELVALRSQATSGAATTNAATTAATTAAATTAVSTAGKNLAQQFGSKLKQIIKNNPRIAVALGMVGGLTAHNMSKDSNTPAPAADSTAPNAPAGQAQSNAQTDPNAPDQSGQSGPDEDVSAIKAEIDALIKELESSTDANIKKELDRIKGKLEPKPARLSDNPSIIGSSNSVKPSSTVTPTAAVQAAPTAPAASPTAPAKTSSGTTVSNW